MSHVGLTVTACSGSEQVAMCVCSCKLELFLHFRRLPVPLYSHHNQVGFRGLPWFFFLSNFIFF